jgi:hypothetical protein
MKILETWNSPSNPFDYFKNDMFGKCEICFRAGYCTISECRAQEKNEINIINSVLNNSKLRGKVDEQNPNVIMSASHSRNINKAIPKLENNNKRIMKRFHKSLAEGLERRNYKNVFSQIEGLYQSFFDSPFEIPKNVTNYFNSLKHDDDLSNIKSNSLFTDLQDRIEKIEAIWNQINNNNNVNLERNDRYRMLIAIKQLRKDFHNYEEKLEKNIFKMDNNKENLEKIKHKIINLNNENSLNELREIENKTAGIIKNLHQIIGTIHKKSEKLDGFILNMYKK